MRICINAKHLFPMAAYDGYKDDEFYICRGDSVYAKIRKNFSDQGRNLALDLLNAKRALDKAGLIVTEVERRGTEKEKNFSKLRREGALGLIFWLKIRGCGGWGKLTEEES